LKSVDLVLILISADIPVKNMLSLLMVLDYVMLNPVR
jgi:hypothetical protein